MVAFDNTSSFVYGSELQGRGYATDKDVIIGTVMLIIALLAVFFGSLNLVLIWKMEVFHNAFGWFWASRTMAEVINNFVHVVYSAPITIMQPNDIPPFLGVSVFMVGYMCAFGSCIMHQILSLNRCIALYCPLKYKTIFSTSNCAKIIVACWIPVPLVISCYIAFPCNLVGYSPQLYEYSFIKCYPDLNRNYSIVGTIVNRSCWLLCCITMTTDISTLIRIIYIRKVLKLGSHSADFNRDVRLFMQTTVQNTTMVMATTIVVIANNEYNVEDEVIHILGFNTVILTHVNNALALLIFNPEVRNLLCRRVSPSDMQSRSGRTHAFSGRH